jgi:hypothetical protein
LLIGVSLAGRWGGAGLLRNIGSERLCGIIRRLAWLRRDDYSASDWPAVREEAARAHNQRTAEYLLGLPLAGDFLEEGLSMLGHSCGEFEIERL